MTDINYILLKTDGTDGFDFTHANQTLKIEEGCAVESTTRYGVLSKHTGVEVNNLGSVLSDANAPYGIGVYFKADSDHLLNAETGYVSANFGVIVDGSHDLIENYGGINGESGVGVTASGSAGNFILDNYHGTSLYGAEIKGKYAGVYIASTADGGTILNGGSIESKTDAIKINTGAGLVTDITSTGEIGYNALKYQSQSHAAIYTEQGAIKVVNSGNVDGNIICAAPDQNDYVRNTGIIYGNVFLGSGNDVFSSRGGTVYGAVYGGPGSDVMVGGTYDPDDVWQVTGKDFLHGGLGNDTLTGGPGHDKFFFDTKLNAATNVDRIADFTHGVDKIVLSRADFANLNKLGAKLASGMFHEGGAAHDANDHIIYNPANGWLIYDTNGNAVHGATHFATLAPHLALASTDFLVEA